jgi:hypothetical protein
MTTERNKYLETVVKKPERSVQGNEAKNKDIQGRKH